MGSHIRPILVGGAMALAWAWMPQAALPATPATPPTTRFLSPDGIPLPDDYRIDPTAWTFFVVPGFQDPGTSAPSLSQADAIRQAYLEANVIVVDWHVPAQVEAEGERSGLALLGQICGLYQEYRKAAAVSKQVGRRIAEWMKAKGVPPSRTVICGHSLGAQIAAFASNECARSELCDEPVGILVATDPAGPCFELNRPGERLDKTDADRVIVVHTTEVFGDENPIGTWDIYVEWPESEQPDYVWQHSQARELVTASFVESYVIDVDGSPANADFADSDSSDAQSQVAQLERPPNLAVASTSTAY